MRLMVAIVLAGLMGGRAHAQVQAAPPQPAEEPIPPPPPAPPAPPQAQPAPEGVPYGVPYAAPYGSPYGYAPAEAMFRSGRRQRTVGVVLTSVGIGLAVVAGLLWFDADTRHGGDSIDQTVEALFAVLTGAAAVGCIIPGAILWSHGDEKMDQARQMGASGLSMLPEPATSFAFGAKLRLRF